MIKRLFFRYPVAVCSLALLLASCGSDDEPLVNCSVSGPSIAISSLSPATCVTTGSIVVAATGGVAPILYSIDGAAFQESNEFSGLQPGTYAITVKDANECSATTSATLISESDLTIAIETTDAGCGTSDGALSIATTGGDGNYSYSLDGTSFTSNPVFDNLDNGEYTVTVKGGSCEQQVTALISSGVSFELAVSSVITTNCAVAACHVSGSQLPDLTDIKNIQENADDIRARVVAKTMPPSGSSPLLESEIQTIVCWVADGALDN